MKTLSPFEYTTRDFVHVCGPYVVTLLNKTPMFERYVARLGAKD
jgi:hypothetical protein